jgi:hypothetical protein
MSGNTAYFNIQYPSSSDYVKDGATAIQTVATGFDSAVAIPTYNAQTGTTYTFALSDIGKIVTASNAASQTYTIPPQSSVVWVANTTLNVTNLGAGVVTFAAGAGVTVTNTANTLSQYQSAQLIRTGSNAWTVVPTSGIASSPGITLINTTTFSAVSSQSINDVFSATYDNYKIVLNCTHSVSGVQNKLRYRVSGADNSTSNYNWSQISIDSTSPTVGSGVGSGQTSAEIGSIYLSSAAQEINVYNPFLSTQTLFTTTQTALSVTTNVTRLITAGFNATTSFTGFSIIPASGNITGTIRVYGIRN